MFEAKTDPEVFGLIRACKVPPLGEIRTDLPAPMVATIHRALAADPKARQTSARAMVHELNEILRKDDSWGDADVLVSNAVAEARIAKQRLGI